MTLWSHFRDDEYLGLAPWTSLELVSAEPRSPFPYLGGVAQEVAVSLHEAHALLRSALDEAVYDVLCRGGKPEDPRLRTLLEDAYAEIVRSRPHLSPHIQCEREPDDAFRWGFPLDPDQSAAVTFTGCDLENALTGQTASVELPRPILPAIGNFLGDLDGTHPVAEVRAAVAALGRELESHLTSVLERLHRLHCVTRSTRASGRDVWREVTCDQDVVMLGHAGLFYRQRDQWLIFDPWLLPWYAEAPVPSLCRAILPRPSAIFVTHEHDDHMNSKTLLQMPKTIPVIVPSRKNRRTLYYDYVSALREWGFERIVELAHGERWAFDGGVVEALPFYGEDPCDLKLPRNCYWIADRGRNTLVQADSGPTNEGRSAVKDGVIAARVRQYGPLSVVFGSQQQMLEVRGQSGYGFLSHPGRWLETGESTWASSEEWVELATTAKARWFVSYATGGAEWFPEHVPWLLRPDRPARGALTTVNKEPLERLGGLLMGLGCRYHRARAFDIIRASRDGGAEVVSAAEPLDPVRLFERDHPDHPLLRIVKERRDLQS
jgi:hypothetical protein